MHSLSFVLHHSSHLEVTQDDSLSMLNRQPLDTPHLHRNIDLEILINFSPQTRYGSDLFLNICMYRFTRQFWQTLWSRRKLRNTVMTIAKPGLQSPSFERQSWRVERILVRNFHRVQILINKVQKLETLRLAPRMNQRATFTNTLVQIRVPLHPVISHPTLQHTMELHRRAFEASPTGQTAALLARGLSLSPCKPTLHSTLFFITN